MFTLLSTLAIILLLVSSSTILIFQTQSESLKNIETSLRKDFDLLISSQVRNAVSVLQQYADLAATGQMTLEEAKKEAAQMIRNMRYIEDGYFWADTTDGVNVVLLGNATEGTNRYEAQDSNGYYNIKEIIKQGTQEGGGYTDYYFPKAGEDTPLPKRGYSLEFKPFGWVIGTGNYTDDIDQLLQAE